MGAGSNLNEVEYTWSSLDWMLSRQRHNTCRARARIPLRRGPSPCPSISWLLSSHHRVTRSGATSLMVSDIEKKYKKLFQYWLRVRQNHKEKTSRETCKINEKAKHHASKNSFLTLTLSLSLFRSFSPS